MNLLSDPLFCALAIIGVLLTGISKSGFAGGAGVVAVPLMALAIPITDAIAIMLPLLLLMDLRTIQYYWRQADFLILRQIVPAALLGIAVGGMLIGKIASHHLQMILAVISILFAVWHRLTPFLANLRFGSWLWGSLSGFSSTLVHAGGPPINVYFLGKQLQKTVWLASAGVFFGVMNLVKLIPYSLNDQWNMPNLIVAAILIPFAFIGVWLGKRIQTVLSEDSFIQSCRVLLFVSGILLLLKSVVQ